MITISNLEEIEKFMSQIDDSWEITKKARYILVNLCQIYNYSPKYNYSSNDREKQDMLQQVIENQKRINENNIYEDNEFLQEKNKICVDLSSIYRALLKKAGINKIEQLGGDIVIYTDERAIVVNVAKALLSCKIMSVPEGFGTEEEIPNVRQIDKELGFIENDYNSVPTYLIENDKKSSVQTRLKSLFEKETSYIEKTIGRKLKNVEFHKYYKLLLRTYFNGDSALIFPLHDDKFDDIKYVVIGKDEDEFCYFLYSEEEQKFTEVLEKQIKSMIGEGFKIPDRYDISL